MKEEQENQSPGSHSPREGPDWRRAWPYRIALITGTLYMVSLSFGTMGWGFLSGNSLFVSLWLVPFVMSLALLLKYPQARVQCFAVTGVSATLATCIYVWMVIHDAMTWSYPASPSLWEFFAGPTLLMLLIVWAWCAAVSILALLASFAIERCKRWLISRRGAVS